MAAEEEEDRDIVLHTHNEAADRAHSIPLVRDREACTSAVDRVQKKVVEEEDDSTSCFLHPKNLPPIQWNEND
jgi:hypothetical protein